MTMTKLSVVAVSVGSPRDHSMKGHRVSSSIARKALPGRSPLHLTVSDGIQGNRTAAHDAQVYAFFSHHYDRWASSLGIPREDWNWCHWGENLTLTTDPPLDESEVRIGDVWRFGPSNLSDEDSEESTEEEGYGVELEVCGGRVPCSRLAWRCGQGEGWLKEVAESGNCGVYLRVRRGGQLAAGDVGQIVRTKDSEAMPVARIAQMAFGGDSPENRVTMGSLLRQKGLQRMNRIYLQRKLNLLRDKELKTKEGWPGWRPFELVRVQEETPDTKSFYLRPTDGKPLPPYSPGQFMTINLPEPCGLTRCWSLSQWSSDEEPTEYRLTVKRAGPASGFLHDATTPLGIKARAPAGLFTVDRNSLFARRQIYISAGIGLSPIAAMLQAHTLHDGLQKTPAICIHVTKNGSTLVFPELLRGLPSLIKVILFYTEPREGVDILGQDYHHKGRPDKNFWETLLEPDFFVDPMQITPIAIAGKFSDCYICGPPAFEADTRSYLKAAGVPDPCVRTESFVTQFSDEEPPEDLEEARICFTKSQKETQWVRDKSLTILEIAEQAGLEPPKGCEAGACGTCRSTLVSGKVVGGVQEDGGVHICVAKPATPVVEVEI
ncbi:hypothetical protein PISL3812_09130 [Talaromyces islandicus]|uniref:Uncharacterized protein n=1 Tax=Talaromyces islandicus TaxID=28573 RepID=A0A0U1M933_TALIS|nr:hypothetical protein PISL3812_09130 [Talaromyces islandicus]